MSLEQLLFVALFVIVPLLNFLAGLLRRRRQRRPEPQVVPPAPEAPWPTAVMEVTPPEVAPPRPPAPARPAPPVARRRPARMSRADARRAMVLMAILGPCLGLERPVRDAPRA